MSVTGGSIPPLFAYALTAVSGTATLTGYYTDDNGLQLAAAVSYAITSATTLTTLAGGTLPAGASGFVGALSGSALYVGLGGQANGTIASGMTPVSGYATLPTGGLVPLGRVAPALGAQPITGTFSVSSSSGPAAGPDAEAATITGNPVLVGGSDAGGAVRALKTNAGAASSGTLRTVTASDSPDVATLGASADAAVITDTTGTLSGKLRGLVKWAFERMPASLGQKAKTASLPVVLASDQDTLPIVATASEVHIGAVGGHNARIDAGTLTRPADTNAYASGDLVANSVTPGSVTPLTFANVSRATGKGGMIRRVRLRKSGTSVTNASFRLHLYSALPTVTNGDNGAWLSDNAANYVGALDVTVDKAFSDGAAGNGAPVTGSEINFISDTLYGLLEARNAYTPGSAETFTAALEVLQN